MRYYNENPQVEFWMDKCVTLEREIKTLKKDIEWYNDAINKLNHEIKLHNEARTMEYNLYKRDIDTYRDKQTRIEDEMASFNSLPWYKKMFYKFKV